MYHLRHLGLYDLHIHHHELTAPPVSQLLRSSTGVASQPATFNHQPSTSLHLARIEVGRAEISKFLQNGVSQKTVEALKQIGYAHVTLDLQGYRRGSTNEIAPGTPILNSVK